MRRVGQYILFIYKLFIQRESPLTYLRLISNEAYLIGYRSFFIIAIVSAFIGAVTMVQTAYNMVSPLLPSYLIALVVRDTAILELAPTVMAIIFAGKVGSNIAGELGTMRITEQIDVLEVMGINSVSYLVLPKIIASMFTFPILVVFSMFLSIFGGYLAATVSDTMTSAEYVYGIKDQFVEFNVYFALIKAVTFAFLISSISAFTGYYIRGGAFEVGQASTAAVTASCIAILLGDYVLAELLL